MPALMSGHHGADDRGRTDTDFTPPDFESGASANSTTSALITVIIISQNTVKVNPFLQFYGKKIEKSSSIVYNKHG